MICSSSFVKRGSVTSSPIRVVISTTHVGDNASRIPGSGSGTPDSEPWELGVELELCLLEKSNIPNAALRDEHAGGSRAAIERPHEEAASIAAVCERCADDLLAVRQCHRHPSPARRR